MSADMSPQEALARAASLPDDGWRIVPLRGGLTNRSYLASRGSTKLVVRLEDAHTVSFGIDRDVELAAHTRAANAGLASRIVFADVESGILISEHIDGKVWRPGDLEQAANLETLAAAIRRLHALPPLGSAFDPRGAAGFYIEGIRDQPDLLSFGRRCEALINADFDGTCTVFSHNDLVAENIVADKRREIVLLDWEYAGDNDPMFDFACLSRYHDLRDWQVDLLLSAYAGNALAEHRERLHGQQRLFDALQWLWFAVRHSRSPNKRLAARLEEIRQRICP